MIRLARIEDMPRVLDIYQIARCFMRDSGNPNQWHDDYPAEAILLQDVEKQQLYVEETDGSVNAVFVLALGDDSTYAYIEDGAWLSETPYGTIHRIASDGTVPGLFTRCVTFCQRKIAHLRIDTHHDNIVMQHLAEKEGFCRRGIIYIADGSPRIAYEKNGTV